MKEKIEVSELVRRFTGFLSRYDVHHELRILEIDESESSRLKDFLRYYRPLIGVLWLQAVEYHFPDKVDLVGKEYLARVGDSLPERMDIAEVASYEKKTKYFSKLTRRDNGMFIVSMDCLDQLAPTSSNRGERVKQLTIHMLELFQSLLNTLEGFDIVPDGQAPPPLPPTKAKTIRADTGSDSPFFFEAPSPEGTATSEDSPGGALGGQDGDEDDDQGIAFEEDTFSLPDTPPQEEEEPEEELFPPPDALAGEFVDEIPPHLKSEYMDRQEENVVDLDDFKLLLNKERRVEARVPSRGMQALVDGNLREFPVNDISVSGIGIDHQGWQFKVDEVISFDLYYGYKLVLRNVKARIVRRDNDRVGCIFTNVSPEKTELICQKLSKRLANKKP